MMKLSPNIDSLGISRIKFLIGITIGVLFAFWLYSFAYVMREALRVLSVTYDYDIWVLSDSEVDFYNLIYAFIAVIFGQSACFIYWLDRPKRQFGKFSRKFITIVNDQRALNWYFLFWFFKLAFIYGIMFGATFKGGFFLMSFYPDYNYLFVLIIIVLFLNTWTTIRLVFKRRSFKWMLVSMLIVSGVSFGMSKINIVDYRTLNETFLSQNIHHKYTLQLPESKTYKRVQRFSLVEKLYVVYAHGDTIKSNPKIVIPGNVEIDFEDLPMYIESWQSIRDEIEKHKINYIVYVHKEIKMEFINKLKQQFALFGIPKISYAVVPEDREFNDRYYDFYYFSTIIHSAYADAAELYRGLDTFDIVLNINSNKDKSEVNGMTMGNDNMKKLFKDSLQGNSNCIVKLYIDDEENFDTYFKQISKIWEGAYELREEYSQSNYNKPFDELGYDERRIVKKKYPIRVFDMTEARVRKFEPENNN